LIEKKLWGGIIVPRDVPPTSAKLLIFFLSFKSEVQTYKFKHIRDALGTKHFQRDGIMKRGDPD
jgi:hypothetical protein